MNKSVQNIFVLIFAFLFIAGVFAVQAVRPGEVSDPSFTPEQDNVRFQDVITEIVQLQLQSSDPIAVETGGGAFGGYEPDPNHAVTTPTLWSDLANILTLNVDTLCLAGDCRSSWPSGGATGETANQIANIVTDMGFVRSNSLLPIPPGFVKDQCSWIVSPANVYGVNGRIVCYTDDITHTPTSRSIFGGSLFGPGELRVNGPDYIPGNESFDQAIDPKSGVIVHCDEVDNNNLAHGPSGTANRTGDNNAAYDPSKETIANYFIICGAQVLGSEFAPSTSIIGDGPVPPSTVEFVF